MENKAQKTRHGQVWLINNLSRDLHELRWVKSRPRGSLVRAYFVFLQRSVTYVGSDCLASN